MTTTKLAVLRMCVCKRFIVCGGLLCVCVCVCVGACICACACRLPSLPHSRDVTAARAMQLIALLVASTPSSSAKSCESKATCVTRDSSTKMCRQHPAAAQQEGGGAVVKEAVKRDGCLGMQTGGTGAPGAAVGGEQGADPRGGGGGMMRLLSNRHVLALAASTVYVCGPRVDEEQGMRE